MKKIICVLFVLFIGTSNYLFAENKTPLKTGQKNILPLLDRIRELKPARKELATKSANDLQKIESYEKSAKVNEKKHAGKSENVLFAKTATLFKEALVFYNSKYYQEAIETYSSSLKLVQRDAGIFFNRGLAYQQIAQYGEAISDYSRAIELNPWSADIYYNRGVAHHQLGDLESAIKDYDKAIELNPNDADTYWNRGIAFSDKSEYWQAASDYCKVIDMKPALTDFNRAAKLTGI
jgi:tetratricopeptide (TPR) repeat protein